MITAVVGDLTTQASKCRRSLDVAAIGIPGSPVEQAAPVGAAAVREAPFVLVDAATCDAFAAAAGGDG